MDAALFSAHDVNTHHAAVEGEKRLADGSRLLWALSHRHMGPMSLTGRPEWDVAHNRMSFIRAWDLSIDRTISPELDHTSNIAIVDESDRRKGARELASAFKKTDGLVTRDTNLVLMTTHADCLPIYLATPESGWIGMAHAGWRGVEAGVITNLINAVPETEREGLTVAIGPGICADHYEVGSEVADHFHSSEVMAPAVREADGKFHLDLALAAKLQAESAGAIVDMSMFACTYEEDYLSSFRRDGNTFTPMAAIIVREAP